MWKWFASVTLDKQVGMKPEDYLPNLALEHMLMTYKKPLKMQDFEGKHDMGITTCTELVSGKTCIPTWEPLRWEC